VSISILLFAYPKNQFFRGVGLALGVTVFYLGFVFSIGYFLGVPVLYGSTIRPVALPSALAFILLGVSLVAYVGPAHWPWNELLGSSLRSNILRPFLVLTTVIVVSYGWFSSYVIPLTNPALVTALVLLVSLVVVGVVASGIAAAVANRTEKALRRSVNETAAMVGHDLRNPLQGIAGAANILSERLASASDEITKQMLDVLRKDVEYSNNIIVDLVDFSGALSFKLTEVSLRKIVEEALNQFEFPQNVLVRNMVSQDDEIVTDPQRIKRVFVNLIGNALDAMPNGGELTVSDRRFDARIEVTIEDTGHGIPKDVMISLWKGFNTTKAKGLGLGLVTSKRIVEGLGGSISVQSTLGSGTMFVISLPIKPVER
jgi:signal transduction histidine kinase